MLAQGLDRCLHLGERVGSKSVLDGLQMPVLGALVADPLAPDRIPQVVEVVQPFRAGDRGPLARVEPAASFPL